MTNEQLAKFIQLGGADDLKPVLYDRVKFLLYKFAGQHYSKYKDNYNACGVELSDIRQECYGAFLKALEAYKPADETKFTSYLQYPFKNMANSLLGIRNKDRVNKTVLDNCTSLDKPIQTADGECSISDFVADETAEQALENCLDKIEDEHTKEVLTKALDKLPANLRTALMMYYFDNMTYKAIADKENVSTERIRQRVAKGLRKLRADSDLCILRAEQKVEKRLHFTSRYYGEAYFIAQKQIAEIEKRGAILSYGKRQAIIYDCSIKAKQIEDEKYQNMSEIEKIYAKHGLAYHERQRA